MIKIKKLILVFAGIAVGMFPAYSQYSQSDIEKSLVKTTVIENPVKMPVVGVGIGYFNYYGNVNDAFRSHTIGQPGYRVNAAMFLSQIQKKQVVRANIYFMTGNLTGTQRTVSDTSKYKNLNFKSNITSFGANLHYSFKPLIKGEFFEPFISLGVEFLQFDTKADYSYEMNGKHIPYHYWTDGTIRDAPQNGNNPFANIMRRDYKYDVDLRMRDQSGLEKYSQFALAVPVEMGIDFNVSKRVTLRAATSLHYAFTDLIDDMSSKSKNPEYKGSRNYNMYTFTYLSLHLDLFSGDEVIEEDLLFADLDDFDMDLYEDEDGDGVFDFNDLCPDTPPNTPVDTVGCPLDTDGDGVPDYLDREPNSRPGAIVDEYGVEISEDAFIEKLNNMQAIRRSDVASFLLMQKAQRKPTGNVSIPDKFKRLDTNGDGYISFDEYLKAINDYFDGSSNYSPNDLKELNDFFFSQ